MVPKVSVIVCTYNQEDTIGAALDSILAQQCEFDYEIVLSDDASSDGTAGICRQYAARYPDIIQLNINEENLGIADNYYGALYRCRGTYIADLAGDDIWIDTQKLAKQATVMDSDQSIVLCHSAWRFLMPDGSLAVPKRHALPEEYCVHEGSDLLTPIFQHRIDKIFIHLCASMYRRDTAIALSQKYSDYFFGRNLPCEDFQLNVLMATAGRIASEPSVVLAYRTGQPSISSTENPAKAAVFTARVARLTKRLADELCFDTRLLDSFFSSQLLFSVSKAFASGSPEARRQTLLAVSETSPRLPKRAVAAMALMKIKPLWWLFRSIYNAIQHGKA